jgi:hypothetical protein
MEALYSLAAKNIRLAFIDFIKNETAIDLKTVCESLNSSMRFGSGYSYPNVSKWLPSRRTSVADGNATVISITGRPQLIKLFTFLKNCLDEAGFDLLNINNIPVTDWNGEPDNIPFLDETQTRLLARRRSETATPAARNKDERLVAFENSTQFSKKFDFRYVVNGDVASATIYVEANGIVHFFPQGGTYLSGSYLQNSAGVSILQLNTDLQAWQILFRHTAGNQAVQGAYVFYDNALQRIRSGQCVIWDSILHRVGDSDINELVELILVPELERNVKYGKYYISRGAADEPMDLSFDSLNIVLGGDK